jgi:phosphoribosylformylglycinamidine synthase
VYGQTGNEAPDLDSPRTLKALFETVQRLNADGKILAYHDRSDGGLFVTLAEMMFASHVGITADIGALGEDALAALFNEELGAVLQVKTADFGAVNDAFSRAGLGAECHGLTLNRDGRLIVTSKAGDLWRIRNHAAARLVGNHVSPAKAARQSPKRATGI